MNIFIFFLLIPLYSWGSFKACSIAPDFSLRNMNGEMQSLNSTISSSEHKLILVSFFQTTCVPCIQEIRDLLKLGSKLEEAKLPGFELVLVGSKEDRQSVHSFLRKFEFNPKHVLNDPNGKLDKDFDLGSIPVLLVLNKNGQILEDLRGQVLSKIREKMGFEELIEKNLAVDKCR